MKNVNLFSLMKNTAKATQNAGGGASQKLMRHEDARSLAQSDNRYCIGNASDLSPRLVRLDSLSLVSRQSDLDQVRAVSVGLSARAWKHVAMIFAVLVMSMANVGMAWGAASTSSDGKYALGTITFADFGSMSATTNYWYNGIKIYSGASQSAQTSNSRWATDVSVPTYINNVNAGKTTNNISWGCASGGKQYAMSGLALNTHAIGIHVNGKCTVTVVVDRNLGSDTDDAGITASVDATTYGTAWTSSNYSTAGTALTVTSTRADKTNYPGRYTLTIPITTDGEKVVKMCYSSSGAGAGKLFCFESITVTASGGGGCTSHSVNLSGSGSVTGGTFTTSSATVCEDGTATLTATPAAGYEFTSWSATGTGGHSLSSTTTNPATLTMGTADVTVGATFSLKNYTVTLNNQSATSAGTENVTTTYAANTNLTSAITCPTKDGKVFAGYFTAANGGGVQLIDAAGNWIASAGGGSTYLDGSKNWKNDGNLTLYACWMEYASTFDIEAYVQASVTEGSPTKTFTILGTNKLLYDLGGNTELDNSDDATGQYDGLKIKRSGDYVMFLVPANYSLSVKWGYVKSSKPKYSINGGAAQTFTSLSTNADNSSSPGDIEISSQSYIQLVKIWSTDGNATVLKKVTITAPASTYTLTASATVINPMTEESKTGGITATITNSPVSGITSGTTTSTSSNTFTVGGTTVTAPVTVAGSSAECDECTYRFDSWENIPATVTEDVSTIHAKYNTTYTISFEETDGTAVAGISSTYYVYGTGKEVSAYPTPTKIGYAFDGWYQEETLTNEAEDIDDEVYGNITVYAKWTHSVTFHANGGSGSMSTMKGETSSETLTSNSFTKSGCTFYGWATSQANANAGTRAYTDGATIDMSSSSYDLYAIWKLNKPSLSCSENVVSMTEPGSSTVYYTTAASGVKPSVPTSSNTAYNSSSKPTITKDTTFAAIAILANHVSSDTAVLYCTYEEAPAISLPATLDKSNVTDYSSDMTWYGSSDEYFDFGPTDAVNTGRWAEWEVYLVPCEYNITTITTCPNGYGWKISINDTELSYSLPNLERGTDVEWNNVDASASAWDLTSLSAGVYTIRVMNHRQWSQPKLLSLTLDATVYTVTYNANGGSSATASEKVCAGSSVTLPSASGGGAFLGWYNAASDGDEIGLATDGFTPTSDTTLYAQWGASCSDPSAPTDFDLSSVTMTTATFSITDAGDAASYDLYYASGSPSDPTSGTAATKTVKTKTPTITGLSTETTYKIWVRAVCDEDHMSEWVALDETGGAFTTPAPYTITYNKDGATEDQISDGEKIEGENYTLSSSRYTKAGYWQVGWATSQGGSKVYDFGGTYTTDADLALYPAWVRKAEYDPDMSTEAKLTATIDAEFGGADRWTLTTGDYLVSTPKDVSSTAEDNLTGTKYGLAFTPSWSSSAKYDLGAQTTLYQLTLDIVMGGNGSITAVLQDGSSNVVKTLTNDISISGFTAWEKKTFTYTYATGVANVRYIRIYGNGSYVLGLIRMKAEYAPTKTEIVLDNQSATSAGTANVTATYGASTNLTSDITAPTKTNYIFGGYYTEESGAGTQLIDENGAWLASKTDYTDGSKNWQFANPDLTLYAKWTAKTTPTAYAVDANREGLCGAQTATIILSDSQTGIQYQLKNGDDAVGDPVDGTGEALEWEGIDDDGTYTIWAVENETYAGAKMGTTGHTQVTIVVKDDAGLAYDDDEVDKTYGDAAFTNTLTNGNSLSVTYSSSAEGVATVNSSGLVTIAHAGSTTITASFVGDATYCAAEVSYELTVAKADLSVSPSAGTASSVTHYSATLPFTLGSTSGVASVTLKVYKNSDNSLVNTIEGVTAATSGSGNVTGLDAETTYYYTVTPIGDADHNDGAESSKSATFTTSAATLSALVAGTLYEVPDMIPGGESLISDDQFFEGLSANTKFTLIGSASSSTTPKVNNKSSNDRTIAGITFDDGSMWFKGIATVSENIPSTFGLSFIVPSAGKLYLYFDDDDTSTNIKLAKSGTSGSNPTVSSGYSVVDVTSGTYYMYGTNNSSPYSFYGLKFVPTYDITLHDNNGGSNNGSAAVAVNGTTLLDIDAPTRSGYIVTGYYAESDYTTLVADEEGNLEANVTVSAVDWTDEDGKWVKGSGATLYAKWGRVYTVTFNTDGGSSVDAITQASEGASITMPAAPTKSGYTFNGWQIGSTYAAGASYTPTADVTAYATWKAECGVIKWDFTNRTEVTLTTNKTTSYTADDGVTEMRYSAGSSDKIVAYDSKKSIDGHLYENGTTGSGTVYDIDDKTNVGKTRLIRLFVEPGSGTLRINCNGTNGVYKVLDGSASGTTLISSLSANTTSSSITVTTSPLWIETTTKGYINDIRWTPSSTVCYYVTYNGNGADGGYVNDPEAHSSGNNVTTLANSFTRTGCTFTGWNTAADGSGTAYVAGGTISSISGNVTLYAQWKITVSENKNLSEYTSDALSTTDVVVTNGATLTVTEDTEVRNITIETGSTLNVSTTNGDGTGDGVTFTVNSLHLKGGWNSNYTKYDMPRVYIDRLSSLVKDAENPIVNFDISVDSRNYYPFAVPFRVKVSDINYADPTLAYYAQYGATGQYVIKEYDGERRAEKGPDHENNWKVVPQKDPKTNADIYLEPGRGYIMTAISLPAYGGGVIRIPLSFTNAWTALGEQGTVSAVTKNIVPVTAYTGKATEGDKFANKGWNLLGVPFMSCYTTSDDMGTSVVMQGKFNFETGEWDGEDKVRYVNVPVHDFSEYIQVDMEDEKTPTVLRPGWCFFVQIGTTGNLTFLTGDQAASSTLPIYAPKREKANMPIVKTGIILSDGEKSDQTTFLVSDKYNGAEYEINADLEKLFGNGYTLATYSLSGETRLAYNALSNADAANIIPIGYRAPAEGEYTFSINPSYAENGAFESVNLIDYETGIVTDLLVSSYTFDTERTQNDERFALNVVRAPQTATDITVTGDGLQVTGPQKVIINDKLYIIVDGRIYDAKGVMVK